MIDWSDYSQYVEDQLIQAALGTGMREEPAMGNIFSQRDIAEMNQAVAGIEAAAIVTNGLFTGNSVLEHGTEKAIILCTDMLLDERARMDRQIKTLLG